MKHLYLDSGFLNVHAILAQSLPFNLVVGGRGTGKTYGTLKECLYTKRKFLFLRRTQAQADLIAKPEFSPFKKVCEDTGEQVTSFPLSKYNSAICHYDINDDGRMVPKGAPIGYTAALSTFSNIRGFDASDVDLIIFDEFIPERHERPIKNEFDALMNCYETVNRNRELMGVKPVQLLCLANANDLANPVFIGLNLVKRSMSLINKGVEQWIDFKRGIALYLLQHSPISDEKRNTALYKLTAGTSFAEMSLDNKFSANAVGRIASKPLKEYIPVVAVGELCIYRHKSNGTYYATTHITGSPPHYGTGEADIQRFRRAFGWVWMAYMADKITFEEYLCEILLTKFFK